jgi:hypothetical protein
MPNWTSNIIKIKHSNKSLIDAIAATETSEKGVLQHLIPCPEELNDDDLTTWGGGDEAQAAREVKQASMVAKYGFKSWYDWNIKHWGTKWDLCEVSYTRTDDNTIVLSCQTAWSPPTVAFDTLMEQGYEVHAMYLGEGCEYAGIYDNGDDQSYNISNGSVAARTTVPKELDDAFNIIETLEEYERENEEELTLWIKDGIEEKKKQSAEADEV